MKTCPLCRDKFKGYSKWCDQCRWVTFNCYYCGKEAAITRGKYEYKKTKSDRLFCSKPCAQRNATKGAAKKRENFVMVTCPNCGKVNRRKKHWEKRVFCNRQCHFEYRVKHPELYPSQFSNPEIHKKAMKTRTENGTNVFARRGPDSVLWKGGKVHYRGPSWDKQRIEAIQRDGTMCVICGDLGEQVHHIVDFRKFNYIPGQNDNDVLANHLDNLIHLCNPCHGRAKKNNNGIPKSRVKIAQKYFNLATTQNSLQPSLA